MTYFAPVAPLAIHQQLAEENALGSYNLLIASEILKNVPGHRAFWRNWGGFVIMDNGVIELGYPLPIDRLAFVAETVEAAVVVLPDTIDDSNMTIKQVRNANPQWKRLGLPTKTMGVVQGKNFAECMDCADAHIQHGVDYLAVPRGLTPNLGSRIDLVRAIAEENPKVSIHILGFSENIRDDIEAAVAAPTIMGIDAATPVWLGMAGRKAPLPFIPPRTADYGRRPEWFWQVGLQGQDSVLVIRDNVLQVREWLKAASQERQLFREASGQSVVTNVHTGKVEPSDPVVR